MRVPAQPHPGGRVKYLNTSSWAHTNVLHAGTIWFNPYVTRFHSAFAVLLCFFKVRVRGLPVRPPRFAAIQAETQIFQILSMGLDWSTRIPTRMTMAYGWFGIAVSAPFSHLPNWRQLDWALRRLTLRNSFTASVFTTCPSARARSLATKKKKDWNNVTNSFLGGWQLTVIETHHVRFGDPLSDRGSNQRDLPSIMAQRDTLIARPIASITRRPVLQIPIPSAS